MAMAPIRMMRTASLRDEEPGWISAELGERFTPAKEAE